MPTDWIKRNWWFPWASAEEAKVEAFRAWLRGEPIEGSFSGAEWTRETQERAEWQVFFKSGLLRPLHPHRSLIDQYEPGQEWEVADSDGNNWRLLDDEPTFDPDCTYRLKPAKKYRPWTPEEARLALGMTVICKHDKSAHLILSVGEAHGEGWFAVSDIKETLQALLDDYECSDGSPCGVEET